MQTSRDSCRPTQDDTEPAAGARRRVAALLGFSTSTAPVHWLASPLSKGILLAAVTPLIAFAGAVALRSPGPAATLPPSPPAAAQPDPPVPSPRQPSPPVAAAQFSPPNVEPSFPRNAARSRTASTTSVPAPAPSSATALQAEVALIEQATSAIRSGDPDRGLTLLADHARRFPDGQLANERSAYRAVALCSAGKTQQGRAEARLVRSKQHSKALTAWLDAACGRQGRDFSGRP